MQVIIEEKSKLFDTELGKLEILVTYLEKVTTYPMAVYEGHGLHSISEDEVEIELTCVEMVIPKGNSVDLLPSLTDKQKVYIINQLTD